MRTQFPTTRAAVDAALDHAEVLGVWVTKSTLEVLELARATAGALARAEPLRRDFLDVTVEIGSRSGHSWQVVFERLDVDATGDASIPPTGIAIALHPSKQRRGAHIFHANA